MICPRHRLPALIHPYGWPLCDDCFVEAIARASDKVTEDKVRDLRYHSVTALMQRLRWDR